MVSITEVGALKNLIKYNWHHELDDAQNQMEENGDLKGHVFTQLVALDNWLNDTVYTVKEYLG